MNKKFLFFAVLIIAISVTFWVFMKKQQVKNKAASIEDMQQPDSEHFSADDLSFNLGETRKEIIKKLGKPKSSKAQKIQNRHNPELTDEIHELFYDGLYIRIHRVPETKEEFISDISVTSDKYKMECNIGVGSSKFELENILGEPDQKSDDVYTYEALGTMHFYLKGELVYKIEKIFYVD